MGFDSGQRANLAGFRFLGEGWCFGFTKHPQGLHSQGKLACFARRPCARRTAIPTQPRTASARRGGEVETARKFDLCRFAGTLLWGQKETNKKTNDVWVPVDFEFQEVKSNPGTLFPANMAVDVLGLPQKESSLPNPSVRQLP